MRKIIMAVALALLAMSLHAVERLYAMDKAGFLIGTNRYALATYSRATLTVDEQDGKFRLPCRFSFVPGIGGDKSNEIHFSSVSILKDKKAARKQETAAEKIAVGSHLPLPKTLQIDSLVFDVEESPVDFNVIARQVGCDAGSRDPVLYRMLPEKYFRYLCSSVAGGDYWRTRILGKNIDYRIWPVCCEGDEYVVENCDLRSRYFSKMTLTYAKCGEDFRLKKIVVSGDYSYKGSALKSDPASSELFSDFAKASLTLVEKPTSGIVETGFGVLKSQRKARIDVYDQNAKERFKVVIEICETK